MGNVDYKLNDIYNKGRYDMYSDVMQFLYDVQCTHFATPLHPQTSLGDSADIFAKRFYEIFGEEFIRKNEPEHSKSDI